MASSTASEAFVHKRGLFGPSDQGQAEAAQIQLVWPKRTPITNGEKEIQTPGRCPATGLWGRCPATGLRGGSPACGDCSHWKRGGIISITLQMPLLAACNHGSMLPSSSGATIPSLQPGRFTGCLPTRRLIHKHSGQILPPARRAPSPGLHLRTHKQATHRRTPVHEN